MSRKGNCYDNAPMESFRDVLKSELIYHCRHETRQEAIRDITEYIEIFYNRRASRPDSATYLPRPLNDASMKKEWCVKKMVSTIGDRPQRMSGRFAWMGSLLIQCAKDVFEDRRPITDIKRKCQNFTG